MSALFEHEARRDGKVVAVLRGQPATGGAVVVEAEVIPVGKGPGESITLPFSFTSQVQATRFADEALLCLLYLDCDVTE